MKKRKKRNSITTSSGMKSPEETRYTKQLTEKYGISIPVKPRAIESITVAEFEHDDPNLGKEVHLLIDMIDRRDTLFMRFKSPDTLGDFIEQLNFYRDRVFPGADQIDLNREFSPESAESIDE